MLIGGTILSGCLLAVLSFCTLARFSLTVGFLPTAEDNKFSPMGSFCELPQSQWRHIPQNRWTLGGTQLLTFIVDAATDFLEQFISYSSALSIGHLQHNHTAPKQAV